MSDTLGMALSKVLFEYEPKLLDCDMDTTARAAAEVANLLGCVMASVMVLNTPDGYERIFRAVMKIVHESAQKTATKAMNETANLTAH